MDIIDVKDVAIERLQDLYAHNTKKSETNMMKTGKELLRMQSTSATLRVRSKSIDIVEDAQ